MPLYKQYRPGLSATTVVRDHRKRYVNTAGCPRSGVPGERCWLAGVGSLALGDRGFHDR